MNGSPTISRVLRGELCTGCGLCAAVAPRAVDMTVEAPGYRRPRVTAQVSASEEQAIARACPGAVVQPWPADTNTHDVWGPWRGVYTGYATDARVRWKASSGGALTALLIHALRSGLVRRVLHVTADPTYPTRNVMTTSTTEAELLDGAGSRYSASSPLEGLLSALADEGPIAFVGKPCDVSALRGLARVDPRIDRQVPLALSFFCAGIPSHDAADRVLAAMGVAASEVEAFRYRGEGWPGDAAATLHDGTVRSLSYERSWGEHLSGEVQFRCKICPDAVGGVADIACADAWFGDERGYPVFAEQDGRSLIVSRTQVGEGLLGSAVEAGTLHVEPMDVGQIDRMQPGQSRRKHLVRVRTLALRLAGQPTPVMAGLHVNEASRQAIPAEALRNLAGTVRRVLNGRRSRR